MELKFATPAELKIWEGDGVLVRSELAAHPRLSREWLFCRDAQLGWCIEQRKAGKCVRSDKEFRALIQPSVRRRS